MARGYIYVITNEGKPGLCKVGFTERNPEDRAKELDGTHDPFPHEVVYAVKLETAKKIEKKIHEDLKEYRVGASTGKTGREWFRCSVILCKKVIRKYDIVPEDSISNSLPNKELANSPYVKKSRKQPEESYIYVEESYIYIIGNKDRCRIGYSQEPLKSVYYQIKHSNAKEIVEKVNEYFKEYKGYQWIMISSADCLKVLKKFLAE